MQDLRLAHSGEGGSCSLVRGQTNMQRRCQLGTRLAAGPQKHAPFVSAGCGAAALGQGLCDLPVCLVDALPGILLR